jgi:transcriptional repressor NrdR
MECIYCGGETQVVNSRHQKKANQVWRRRRCTACQGIFTSYERADLASSLIYRRDLTHLEPFQRDKLFISIYEACRHRKTAETDARALTDTILAKLRGKMQDASVDRMQLLTVTSEVLKRFDQAASTAYRAFHPL